MSMSVSSLEKAPVLIDLWIVQGPEVVIYGKSINLLEIAEKGGRFIVVDGAGKHKSFSSFREANQVLTSLACVAA